MTADDSTTSTSESSSAPTIRRGRYCADLGDRREIVVFLTGMRINRPLRVRKWWPVYRAVHRMLRELSAQPDSGLLRFYAWPGRTVLVVQYWESFDKLAGFARSARQSHLPAWRAFNTAVADSGDVGIWHETYAVAAVKLAAIHNDMPPFGLLAVPATGRRHTAKNRMGISDDDAPAVPSY
jgi:Domain of unknown function (DUF4188)